MQGTRGRILSIGVLCGVLGVATVALLTLWTSRGAVLRSSGPLLAWLMEHGERARCEQAPASWSLTGPEGAEIWAYDGETLTSHNPAAPPLSVKLRAGLGAADQAIELFGLGQGGRTAARTVRRGACAIMTSRWHAVFRPTKLLGFFALGGLIAGLMGAAISVIATRRPLRELEHAYAQIRADAIEIAARRDELRSQIADVAHDVRTPIASLQLALEQAIDASGDPAAVQACLVRAVHDVVYVGGLVGNLRLASELRAGAVTNRGTTRLDEVIERAALRSAFLARQKKITLEISVPELPIEVIGDSIAIAQAVGNVIENSVAHGVSGGHVAVLIDLLPEGAFELAVIDDGPGVEPSELPRLGERTFRTDAARRRDARGTGLGLAITAEVCRQLGWVLRFTREEPQGLRVLIRGALRPRTL